VLKFAVFGVLAGVLTGVPIGPVNVAVIDAAYRHTMRRALGVAIGGAVADGLYAGVGLVWVTPLLEQYPSVPPILYAISGIVLMVYGFLTARSSPMQPGAPPDPSPPPEGHNGKEMWQGFTVGLWLIVLNPAAVLTWVVIMGRIIPTPSTINALACTAGVIAGSFGWFAVVAHLTLKGKSLLGQKAAWIPRVIGMALMAYAVYLIGKAVKYLVA
jgi:threonine/homoserine/homoserine lactone efflux protein